MRVTREGNPLPENVSGAGEHAGSLVTGEVYYHQTFSEEVALSKPHQERLPQPTPAR
jgi:hypothetical protein